VHQIWLNTEINYIEMQHGQHKRQKQRSCSPETSLQLQRYDMARYREEGTTRWIGIRPF